MFDIGFSELALIVFVLLIVMGPERLPEVARQGAFFVRKIRNWMYDMKSEMGMGAQTHMAPLHEATREITDLKNDLAQFGNDLTADIENAAEKGDELIEDVTKTNNESNCKIPSKKASIKKSVAKSVAKKTTTRKSTTKAKPQ